MLMTNKQKRKTIITVGEAITEGERLLSQCKLLGDKFAKAPDKKLWDDLVNANKMLKAVTVARLKANSDGGNNERIKEREGLIRQLEVIKKTENRVSKSKIKNTIKSIKGWFSDDKTKLNLEKVKVDILNRIDEISKELQEFNKKKIEIVVT